MVNDDLPRQICLSGKHNASLYTNRSGCESNWILKSPEFVVATNLGANFVKFSVMDLNKMADGKLE